MNHQTAAPVTLLVVVCTIKDPGAGVMAPQTKLTPYTATYVTLNMRPTPMGTCPVGQEICEHEA